MEGGRQALTILHIQRRASFSLPIVSNTLPGDMFRVPPRHPVNNSLRPPVETSPQKKVVPPAGQPSRVIREILYLLGNFCQHFFSMANGDEPRPT
jgi:hypothetical protein